MESLSYAAEGSDVHRSARAGARLRFEGRPLVDPLFAPPWSWYGADELVAAGILALERCVGDLAELPPRDEGWRPHVTVGGAHGFADLIDLDGIDRLLGTRALSPPILQVLREGLPAVGPGPARGAPVRSRDALAGGGALVINDAQELWPPLRSFCDLLAVGLGTSATADVHLSLGPGPGLVDHVALDDAFVLQVAGSTRWNLSGWVLVDDRREAPVDGAAAEPEGERVTLEVELAAGQSLTIPEGFTCSARTGTGPTLAIMVWVDGRPIGSPPPSGPGEHFWVGSGRTGSSPLDSLVDLSPTAETVVARRTGVVVWTQEVEDRLVLRTDRGELTASARLAALVHRLLGDPAVSLGDLAGPADLPDALLLVDRLVREGVLAIQ